MDASAACDVGHALLSHIGEPTPLEEARQSEAEAGGGSDLIEEADERLESPAT